MKCPYCGSDNPAGEHFCVNCGGSLNSSAAATTSAGSNIFSPANSGSFDTTLSGTLGANSRTLAPNSQLQSGRYVVEKILGEGGMGTAVLAHDTRVSNKKVVIKELLSENADPEQRQEDVRNFEREVDTLAHLDHPLVPTVTDSFQEGSRYYMVQEYAAGENLEDYMERLKKPMPERDALTYASQVLDILVYLSQQHPPIVHRDIKPANIIVSAKDRRARLVDFGIARADVAKNTKRKQTSALGTPGYAPPEQYQGNADARSDLYALAATLHHLLTNRDPRDYPPFNYPRVRSVNPQVSVETERVLDRALIIDVTKRYQTAAAMKHDIDEILLNHFHEATNISGYLGLAPVHPEPTAHDFAPRPNPIRVDQVRPPRPEAVPQPEPRYGSQRSREYPQQQQQMFAPQPIYQQPRQLRDGNNSYVLMSFIFLLIVVLIIAAVLFILPLFAATGPVHPM